MEKEPLVGYPTPFLHQRRGRKGVFQFSLRFVFLKIEKIASLKVPFFTVDFPIRVIFRGGLSLKRTVGSGRGVQNYSDLRGPGSTDSRMRCYLSVYAQKFALMDR